MKGLALFLCMALFMVFAVTPVQAVDVPKDKDVKIEQVQHLDVVQLDSVVSTAVVFQEVTVHRQDVQDYTIYTKAKETDTNIGCAILADTYVEPDTGDSVIPIRQTQTV